MERPWKDPRYNIQGGGGIRMSEEHKAHITFCPRCGEAIIEPDDCCLEGFVEDVREKAGDDPWFAVNDVCSKCNSIITFLYNTAREVITPIVIFDTDQDRHRITTVIIQGLLVKHVSGEVYLPLLELGDIYRFDTRSASKQNPLVSQRHKDILEEWDKLKSLKESEEE